MLDSLRPEGYESLVGRFLDSSETSRIEAGSGVVYQVQVQGFWDSGQAGDLRVSAAVDDGVFRAFSPLVTAFIIRPDGTFVRQ